jgi:hypothetical protein
VKTSSYKDTYSDFNRRFAAKKNKELREFTAIIIELSKICTLLLQTARKLLLGEFVYKNDRNPLVTPQKQTNSTTHNHG